MEPVTGQRLVEELKRFIESAVEAYGGDTQARNPGHRQPFHWPPHPISPAYHVLTSDWTGKATLELDGETFPVVVATTPNGVFGRCDALWCEAKGDSVETMLENLGQAVEPLLSRQRRIAKAIGRPGRFAGSLAELSYADLLKLLYCEDRDVANDARIAIETHASAGVFAPALIEVLRDLRHPYRRSAQWCVLDLFEDLPSFCHHEAEQEAAVDAMRDLIWDAEDDYARTTFKAGVVLGGHLPATIGGPVLIECLEAPSKFGRRAAIHGLFHVVEWDPDQRDEVVAALRSHAKHESVPELAHFAAEMADDIAVGDADHVTEPLFAEEQ